eukprot:610734-Hanusia_phi.AAC.1
MLAKFSVLQVAIMAVLAPTSPVSSTIPPSFIPLSSQPLAPSFFRLQDASGRHGGIAFCQFTLGNRRLSPAHKHVCGLQALAGRRPQDFSKKKKDFKETPKHKGLFEDIRKDIRKEATQQEKNKAASLPPRPAV